MNDILHSEVSRDSLYDEAKQNLETVYALWIGGQSTLRFSIPILCAVKLEAFINVAGKLNVKNWDSLERKLSFKAKCKTICTLLKMDFNAGIEPNKAAIETFAIRNSLVHPKMLFQKTDEHISQEEYERRRGTTLGIEHPLRAILTPGHVTDLKAAGDAFIMRWGPDFFEGQPDYWLGWGSTGGFTFQPSKVG